MFRRYLHLQHRFLSSLLTTCGPRGTSIAGEHDRRTDFHGPLCPIFFNYFSLELLEQFLYFESSHIALRDLFPTSGVSYISSVAVALLAPYLTRY